MVSASRWVVTAWARPQARLRLFYLPYAGGGASAYQAWAARLPGDVEVCAVQQRRGETAAARQHQRRLVREQGAQAVAEEREGPVEHRREAVTEGRDQRVHVGQRRLGVPALAAW